MRRRRAAWWSAGVLILLVVAAVVLWPRHGSVKTPTPPPPPAPPPVTIEAQGPATTHLGELLDDVEGFAEDATYLVAASVYARCHPEHAHELGRMAARARLPVLTGAGQALGEDDEARRAFLGQVRDLATRAPCGQPFTVAVGAFRRTIDADAYARAFPDSYFDATLTAPPMDAADRSLAERATDQCGSVVYAVLPLDQPYAWQCTGLRAQARARVLALCHASTDAVDAGAMKIRDEVNRLPATCR